jgi:hypothetical protein
VRALAADDRHLRPVDLLEMHVTQSAVSNAIALLR